MTDDKVLNFTGTIHTEDLEARKLLIKLEAKIDEINNRTKGHTFQIQELEKKLKEKK